MSYKVSPAVSLPPVKAIRAHNYMSDSLLHFSVFSSLGFEGLLLAVPALILQLLQLLQDSSGLVRGVDQHAQQLEAKGEKVQIKKKNKLPLQLRNSQEKNREPPQQHEEKRNWKDKRRSPSFNGSRAYIVDGALTNSLWRN